MNPDKKLTFNQLIKGPYHESVIKPFVKGVYGKELDPTQATELFLEHHRKFRIGSEATVFGDLSYVRDTNERNGMSYESRLINYNAADAVFNAYEGGFGKGGESAGSAILDYAEGFVKSPSLYIGLLIGGGSGKVAQMAQSKLTQEAIKQYAKSVGKNVASNQFGDKVRNQVIANFGKQTAKQQAVKAGAFEAGVAGLTDVGMQSVEKETGRRTSYSAGRVLGSAALAGGIAGGLTYPLAKWQATQAAKLQNTINKGQFKIQQDIKLQKKNIKASKIRSEQVKKITEAIKLPVDRLFKDEKGTKETWDEATKKGQAMLSKLFGDSSLTHAQVNRQINENLGHAVEEILSRASADPNALLSGAMRDAAKVDKAISKGQINKIFDIDSPDKFTQQVFTAIGRGDIDTKMVQEVMEQYGLSVDDFRVMWWSTISEAGRTLGLWGNVAKKLKMTRPELEKSMGKEFEKFTKAGTDAIGGIEKIAGYGTNTTLRELEEEAARSGAALTSRSLTSVYRQADNFRRAMMVSQPKTFVRNALSVTGRLPMDAGARLIDNAMAFYAMRGNGVMGNSDEIISNVNMNDANSIFKWLFNNQAAGTAIDRFMKHIGKDSYGALSFMNDYSEISRIAALNEGKGPITSKFTKITQDAADLVNHLNRMQEMTFRRAVFMGSIERQLGRMGIIGSKKNIKVLDKAGKPTGKTELKGPEYETFGDFVADGGLEKTAFWTNKDNDLIGRAIDDAMEFTFQGRSTGSKVGSGLAEKGVVAKGFDTFGKAMVDLIANPTGLTKGFGTSLIPFPRFLYNSLKFQLEYSPFGLLDATFSDLGRAARRGNDGKGRKAFITGKLDYGPRTYDYSAIGKGSIGSAMYLAAYAYTKTYKKPEGKWNEFIDERGQPMDAAPLGPNVAPYLFWADAIDRWWSPNTKFDRKKANEILAAGGDLSDLEEQQLIGGGARGYRSTKEFLREAVKAGIGTQAKVGPFSSALDNFIVDRGNLENLTPDGKVRAMQPFFTAYEKIAPFVGDYLNSFLMPLQVVGDIASVVDPEQDIVRETKIAGPVYGKIKNKIPQFAQRLLGLRAEPARQDPFSGISRKQSAITGQLTGLQVSGPPKSPEFAEAQRLGISYTELIAFNEDPSLDYAYRSIYSDILDKGFRNIIEGDYYKQKSDIEKIKYWKDIVIPMTKNKARDHMKNRYVEKMYPNTNLYDVMHEIEKLFPTLEDRKLVESYGGFEVIDEYIEQSKDARKRIKEMTYENENVRAEVEKQRKLSLINKLNK